MACDECGEVPSATAQVKRLPFCNSKLLNRGFATAGQENLEFATISKLFRQGINQGPSSFECHLFVGRWLVFKGVSRCVHWWIRGIWNIIYVICYKKYNLIKHKRVKKVSHLLFNLYQSVCILTRHKSLMDVTNTNSLKTIFRIRHQNCCLPHQSVLNHVGLAAHLAHIQYNMKYAYVCLFVYLLCFVAISYWPVSLIIAIMSK